MRQPVMMARIFFVHLLEILHSMRRHFLTLGILLAAVSLLISSPALAQTTSSVNLSVNPNIFNAGQSASTFLCVTASNSTTITLLSGDNFAFVFDSSVGAVTAVSSVTVTGSG